MRNSLLEVTQVLAFEKAPPIVPGFLKQKTDIYAHAHTAMLKN